MNDESMEPTQTLGWLSVVLNRTYGARLGEALAPLGIAPAQLRVLVFLWDNEGITQSAIAAAAGPSTPMLARPTLTLTLQRMERDGLVKREPDPSDSRARLIFLTPRARELRAAALRAAFATDDAAMSTLSNEERLTLRELLDRVIAALTET